jgi:hypothetical protein
MQQVDHRLAEQRKTTKKLVEEDDHSAVDEAVEEDAHRIVLISSFRFMCYCYLGALYLLHSFCHSLSL